MLSRRRTFLASAASLPLAAAAPSAALPPSALTSGDDTEILALLRRLIATDAGTGFMHESFDADDPARFNRP